MSDRQISQREQVPLDLEIKSGTFKALTGRAHPGADTTAVHAGRMMARMLNLMGERTAGGCAEEKYETQRQQGGNGFECMSCTHPGQSVKEFVSEPCAG